MKNLPMPEPQCFPDGRILYLCALGCNWGMWGTTPSLSDLDVFVETSHVLMSNHYRNAHGVVCDE